MIRSLRPALVLALGCSLAPAQFFFLEVSELSILPQPGQPTAIELTTSVAPVELAHYSLVINGTSVSLPSLVVPPFTSFVVYPGSSGSGGPSHVHLPSAPPLTASGAVALFETHSSVPADLVGYIDWGGFLGPQIAQAVAAGKWTSIADSAPVPAAVGSTLANRWQSRTGANLVGPDAWFDDSTPTLGAANDPGWTNWYALGCPNSSGPGIGLPGSWDVGPWLGEPYSIVVTNVPAAAVLVLSLTATPPIDLDGLGMPGCFAHLTLDATVLLGPSGAFGFVPPVAPQFTGLELRMQAFVPDATVPNPAQALVTEAVRATIGSR